ILHRLGPAVLRAALAAAALALVALALVALVAPTALVTAPLLSAAGASAGRRRFAVAILGPIAAGVALLVPLPLCASVVAPAPLTAGFGGALVGVLLPPLAPVFRSVAPRVLPHDDPLLRLRLEPRNRRPLLVQQVHPHVRVDRQLDAVHALVAGRDRQAAHDVQAHALRRLDQAPALAVGAVEIDRPLEARAHALAGHLDDAELAHAEHLGFGPVALEVVVEALLQLAAVALEAQVDEVADDHPAQVAQPELAGDFVGGLEVGLE